MNPGNGSSAQARVLVRTALRSTTYSQRNRSLAQELVWRWVAAKWPGLMPLTSDLQASHIERLLPGRKLSVSTSGDGSVWTLEVAYSERDRMRSWITKAQVADTGEADVMGLQTSCFDRDTVPPPVVAPPSLLGAWVERLDFEDGGVAVLGEPRMVGDQEQLQAFCDHVLSDKRALPIIALANKPNSRYYGVDPRGLAEAVRGLAHVACLAPDLASDVTRRFGKTLSPVQGAARIYAPGFTATASPKENPLIRDPAAHSTQLDQGAGGFRRSICRRVCAMSVGTANGFDPLIRFPGAAG
jgi:hypothetical protein